MEELKEEILSPKPKKTTTQTTAKQVSGKVLFCYLPKGAENFLTSVRAFAPKVDGKFKAVTIRRGVTSMPSSDWQALQLETSFLALVKDGSIAHIADTEQLIEEYKHGRKSAVNLAYFIERTQVKSLLELWLRWIDRENEEKYQDLAAKIRVQLTKIEQGTSKPYLPSNDWADLPTEAEEIGGLVGNIDDLDMSL